MMKPRWTDLTAAERREVLRLFGKVYRMERAMAGGLESDADEGRGFEEDRAEWRAAAKVYRARAARVAAALVYLGTGDELELFKLRAIALRKVTLEDLGLGDEFMRKLREKDSRK